MQKLALEIPYIQASQPDDAAEHAGQVQAQGWSDQELLLLLEGVELYGDNWADIAEHVGTKSQVIAGAEVVAALPGLCSLVAATPKLRQTSRRPVGVARLATWKWIGNLLDGSLA